MLCGMPHTAECLKQEVGLVNSEVISGIIGILVSMFFYVFSLGFPKGTSDGVPGPGYFPQILAVCLFLLSIGLIVLGTKSKTQYFKLDDRLKRNIKPLLLTIVAMISFVIMWKYLPFAVSAFVYLTALCLIYKMTWKFSIFFSAISTAVIYVTFEKIFRVTLNI